LLTPRGPIPKKTSSGGRRKKRFSASENHFFKPLPPKAPALREKKRFSASKNHFFKPLPLPRHQLWKKSPYLEEIGKNDFGKQKSHFP